MYGDLPTRLLESLTDGLVVLGFDGVVRHANPSAEALLGVSPLEGRHIHDFLDETGRDQSVEFLRAAERGDLLDAEVDTLLIRGDGAPLWVRLRQSGLFDGERCDALVLRLTDNHATKEMLEWVFASRSALIRAERIARSGNWTWDLRAGTTSFSDGLRELYGDHTISLMAQDRERLLDLTHTDDRLRLTDSLDSLLDGTSPRVDLEVRQQGRDGWMWVRLRAEGVYDDDGALLEATGTYQDITRVRDTEDQLQSLVTHNSLMQSIATAANDATSLREVLIRVRSLVLVHEEWVQVRAFVPSRDGSRLDAHPAMTQDDLADGGVQVGLEREAAGECFRTASPTWDPRRLTLAVPVHLESETVAVLAITSAFRVEHPEAIIAMGEQVGLLIARVVERERAATELARTRDRAVRASQHKSDFLATMSHEIRTPLNGIIGLNQLLWSTELSERQQNLVSGIAVSGRTLLELINDTLDLSKIEAGQLQVETVDFEIREVLAEVANILGESAASKDVELQVSCDSLVPDVVAGDPTRLRQVLLNLGSNAVKFTAEGVVSMTVSLEGSESDDLPGSLVRFEVRDTGIGIAPDQRDHIFTAFSQGDSSTTRRFGGTGLGLSICSEIVRAFGSEIQVDSEVGVGSVFRFSARLQERGTAPGTHLARARSALDGVRVLVLHDAHTSSLVLKEQLSWWGAETTVVGDVAAADSELVTARRNGRSYDIVLLDLEHRGPSDVAALLERVDRTVRPVTVLLTSTPTPAADDLGEAGVTRVLVRPVSPATLRETLREVVHQARHLTGPPSASSGGSRLARRGRVLVIEDNALNRLVARGLLEAQGFEVQTADDGDEALLLLQRTDVDAVLMDVQMPRLDGYATTRALRRQEAQGALGHLPVIAMTASAVEGEQERCLAAGMDDFITKPVMPDVLAAVLRRWIGSETQLTDGAGKQTATEPGTGSGTGSGTGQRSRGTDAEPVLDLERLEMLDELRRDGAVPYLQRVIASFLERASEMVDDIASAVERGSADALVFSSHALLGNAGNLGLPVVAEIAERLEELGRADLVAETPPLLAELDEAVQEACHALVAYRDGDGDGDGRLRA